ncbi:MAG: hypothetical protein HY744_16300, partial [Deltaproteobacteria bacterium]|nr:hypothetical protein [Deltaproteobacteria bacterium]
PGATGTASSGEGGGAAAAGGAAGAAWGGAAGHGGASAQGGGAGGGAAAPATMAALGGLLWALPCEDEIDENACKAGQMQNSTAVDGTPGAVYEVQLRLRGVAEQNSYAGGAATGMFYAGGEPDNDGWNAYRIEVSAPAQHYFLNHGSTGTLHCFAIDYAVTIPIAGGATVSILADAMDGVQVCNCDAEGEPIIVPGVQAVAQPYDGQFVEMTVEAVSVAE